MCCARSAGGGSSSGVITRTGLARGGRASGGRTRGGSARGGALATSALSQRQQDDDLVRIIGGDQGDIAGGEYMEDGRKQQVSGAQHVLATYTAEHNQRGPTCG